LLVIAEYLKARAEVTLEKMEFSKTGKKSGQNRKILFTGTKIVLGTK